MAEGPFVAQENARSCVNIDFGIAIMARKSIDAAAKDAEKRDVRTLVLADLIRGFIPRAMRNHVMNHQIVSKCIGPKLGWKIGRKEHGADSISNGAVRTLNSTVLERGCRSGDFDCVSCLFKKVMDFSTSAKLTTLIKTNTAIWDIRGVTRNEFLNEVKRRTLVTTNGTTERAIMVTGDQNIACFTIETSETFKTLDSFISFASSCFGVDGRNFERAITTSLDLRIKIKD